MKSVVFAVMAALVAATANAADKPVKAPAANGTMLQKFDKNGDGALDAAELATAIAQHKQHHAKKSGKMVKATKGPANDLAKAEALIKRFDANGDGKLDASELQAMRTGIQAHHEARKPTGS
jgi:hypothetical protein